jgi:hypothetical protein
VIETLERIIDPLRAGLMVLAVAAFVVIVAWTLLRSPKQIEADAHLWKDED